LRRLASSTDAINHDLIARPSRCASRDMPRGDGADKSQQETARRNANQKSRSKLGKSKETPEQ
jgi:hypothetical protein